VQRQGRDLEILVANIEMILGGRASRVESPAFLQGELSGSVREVDVFAEAYVGSSPVSVILEARDHSRRQGTAWVEQVASKRADVRADVAVAVSRSGFTAGAIALAEAVGVQLRTVQPRSTEYVLANMSGTLGTMYASTDGSFNARLARIDGAEPDHLSELLDAPPGGLFARGCEQPLSYAELCGLIPLEIMQEAVVSGDKLTLIFALLNPRPDGLLLEYRTEDGVRINFDALLIEIELNFTHYHWEISEVEEYSSPDGTAFAFFLGTIEELSLVSRFVCQTGGADAKLTNELLLIKADSTEIAYTGYMANGAEDSEEVRRAIMVSTLVASLQAGDPTSLLRVVRAGDRFVQIDGR